MTGSRKKRSCLILGCMGRGDERSRRYAHALASGVRDGPAKCICRTLGEPTRQTYQPKKALGSG